MSRKPSGYASSSTYEPTAASTHSAASSGEARHAVPNSMSARRSCRISPRSTDRRALPSVAGPSVTGPSTTGPSTTGPSVMGPSTTGPSAMGPSAMEPSAMGPSAAGPSAMGFAPLQARLGEAGGLQGEHLGVGPAGRDKLVVRAEFGDASLIEHG